jgi:hypothetical protein
MDGEGVPVPAFRQSSSHTISLKPAWLPDGAPTRPARTRLHPPHCRAE